MANKSKKSSPEITTADENVVRITASPSASKKKTAKTTVAVDVTAPAKPAKVKKPRTRGVRGLGLFRAIGGYFKGAWVELRLVRWPNRRATWSLTGAVLIYSAFFVVLVLLLDAAFKYLFELALGK
ncbi:MAG: preprotein translocase subunit SecE [Candidatus Saccharimonadales bacterium]